MLFRRFIKVLTSDPSIKQIQDYLESTFSTLGRLEILDGKLIKDVDLGVTLTSIAHGLQRKPKGWIVARIDAAAILHETTNDLPDRFLDITASAPCRASLWVF